MSHVNTQSLEVAIRNPDHHPEIDTTTLKEAIEIINKRYSDLKLDKEPKVDHHALWNPALFEAGIADLLLQSEYRSALARYYNAQREMVKIWKAEAFTVTKCDSRTARILVHENLQLQFKALMDYGILKDRNVDLDYTVTQYGSAVHTKKELERARRAARVAMNKTRRRLKLVKK